MVGWKKMVRHPSPTKRIPQIPSDAAGDPLWRWESQWRHTKRTGDGTGNGPSGEFSRKNGDMCAKKNAMINIEPNSNIYIYIHIYIYYKNTYNTYNVFPCVWWYSITCYVNIVKIKHCAMVKLVGLLYCSPWGMLVNPSMAISGT